MFLFLERKRVVVTSGGKPCYAISQSHHMSSIIRRSKSKVVQGPGKSWLHPRTHLNVVALRVVFSSSSSLFSSSSSQPLWSCGELSRNSDAHTPGQIRIFQIM